MAADSKPRAQSDILNRISNLEKKTFGLSAEGGVQTSDDDFSVAGDLVLQNNVLAPNLPTSMPAQDGYLWLDGTTVKVSSNA